MGKEEKGRGNVGAKLGGTRKARFNGAVYDKFLRAGS